MRGVPRNRVAQKRHTRQPIRPKYNKIGSRTCKPNSVRRCRRDGHSSRPFIAAWLKRPTRRFGAPSRHARALGATPSLFGLAPCGVCPARCIAAAAVRSYRTFSPLPQFRRTKAVCFLWHFPSTDLEASLPDVIRHTALRSSDFPPAPRNAARATVRSGCQLDHYIRCVRAVIGRWSIVLGRWQEL